MRVFYSAVTRRPGPTVYRHGTVEWCCASACRWWGVLIGFGTGGRPSTDWGVNLFATCPQVNGKPVLELAEIAFCPFCGEPVETCRAK